MMKKLLWAAGAIAVLTFTACKKENSDQTPGAGNGTTQKRLKNHQDGEQ